MPIGDKASKKEGRPVNPVTPLKERRVLRSRFSPSQEGMKREKRVMPVVSEEKLLSGMFTKWCNTQDIMINKRRAFEREVHANLSAKFKIFSIYRDRATTGGDVEFFDSDDHLRSPVEYWRIELESSPNQFVLPKPVDPNNFRDLTHVYQGNVFPKDLKRIRPAKISFTGDSYKLITLGGLQ